MCGVGFRVSWFSISGCRLRFLKFRCLGVQGLGLCFGLWVYMPASFSVRSAKYVCVGLFGAL